MDHIVTRSAEIEKQIISASVNNRHYVIHGNADYFLNSNTQKLFRLIQKAVIAGEPYIDRIVEERLSPLYAECLEMSSFNLNPQSVLDRQRDLWLQSKARHTVTQYAKNEFSDPRKEISDLWNELVSIVNGHETEQVDSDEVIRQFEAEQAVYEENRLAGRNLVGYSMGFPKLDDLADGLRSEHLWVVGGYTSAGKTFWALNVTANLLSQGIPVAFYSLEMSKVDVFGRIVGILSGINSRKIVKGGLNSQEEAIVGKAKETVRKSGLRVHSEKSNLQEIIMSMNMEMLTGKAKVFVIDYAQLVTTSDQSEYDTMRRLATELQAFCRKKKVPVILLSQVSNENAKNPENNIIGFKGSGALGASADVAIEIVPNMDIQERNEAIAANRPVSVKLCVKKNRHGRIRNIVNRFTGLNGRFEEDDLHNAVE